MVTVNRVGGAAGSVSAGYTTVNGTATAGADFSSTSGTVSWAEGETSAKTISVPVKATAAGKSFSLALTFVAGVAGFGTPSSATIAMNASSTGSTGSSGGSSSSSSSSSGSASAKSGSSLSSSGGSSVSASAGSACSSSSPTSSTACLLAFINGLSGQSRHILSGQHTSYWDSNPMDVVTP
ncbi:MAG: Calx-beta domain-containing protein, partial [Steroidobacteraceae bacterium]